MILIPREIYKCTYCGKETKDSRFIYWVTPRYPPKGINPEDIWENHKWYCKHDGLTCNECKNKNYHCATCGNGVELI